MLLPAMLLLAMLLPATLLPAMLPPFRHSLENAPPQEEAEAVVVGCTQHQPEEDTEEVPGLHQETTLGFLCSLRFVLLCFNWHAPCMARTTAKPQLRMHARFSSLHSNFHALAFHAFALHWSVLRLGSTFSQQHTHAAHELETRLFRGSLDGFGGLCCACGSA